MKREVENYRKKEIWENGDEPLSSTSGNQFRCSFCINFLPDPTGSYVQDSLELCGSMANKNMGCSVTFDLQINNEFFFFCMSLKKHYLCIYNSDLIGCPVFYQVTYFKGISLQITGTGLFSWCTEHAPGDAVRDPVLLVSK